MAEALARGVRIRSAECFHRMPPDHVTLVLSYAGLSEANRKRAGARLAEAYLAVVGRRTICEGNRQAAARKVSGTIA